MLTLIIFAIIVAVVVGLIAYLVGTVIRSAGGSVPMLAAVGDFLLRFCWVIGLLAGLLYFISGGSFGKL